VLTPNGPLINGSGGYPGQTKVEGLSKWVNTQEALASTCPIYNASWVRDKMVFTAAARNNFCHSENLLIATNHSCTRNVPAPFYVNVPVNGAGTVVVWFSKNLCHVELDDSLS
jgi:hypothetical protein